MAFNGSGVFNRIYNWVNDANNNIDITASRVDTEDTGFASGLSNCICKDGQTTVTADLPMATFKHTNVGNAAARNQYASAGQVQDGGLMWAGTAGGTSTVATLTLSPAITAYVAGQRFAFICAHTSGTGCTMNVNGVGAVTVKTQTNAGLVAISAGDMLIGQTYEIIYDGTFFQLENRTFAIATTPTFYSGGATTVALIIPTSNVTYPTLQICTGEVAVNANSSASVTFINAFTSVVWGAVSGAIDASGIAMTLSCNTSTTAITIYNTCARNANPASYIVIGY